MRSIILLLVSVLAASALQAQTFSNPAPLLVPGGAPTTTVGPASPYPSNITVSGVSGTVTKATVTLTNVSHTFPDDIDILLVGPTGATVILMSDSGGALDVTNVNLTFDDAAAAMLPDSTQIVSGIFKPTNFVAGDTFPAPAPASPYGTTLAGSFNGTNPNGTWRLYVADDLGGDVGSIAGGWSLTLQRKSAPFDFDGDGKTDIGIFRPLGGASEWWINRSSTGVTFALQFGASTDRIAPADYTGDGKADIAFFRPSSGQWFVLRSEDFSFFALPFGTNGDVPVPADYDADGKADFAVFRPSNSTWFISQSSGAPTRIFQFGISGDQPVVADYDGDSKADVGIFRAAAGGGEWWIERSTAGLLAMQFGANTDKAVQGDYTGDGKADVAIWRPSTGQWLIMRSEDFSFFGCPFGANGDTPSPGDYDGDGKFDATVFRPSNSTWFIGRTTAGTLIVQFGAAGDRPIPNAFVP
ncbi:hypothetical protein BH18ACI3_BH18ACI3_17810 [soil metagenome]